MVRCARCERQIAAQDWVRRAERALYHLACFACDACKRQLSTGERFGVLGGRVLCAIHYADMLELLDRANAASPSGAPPSPLTARSYPLLPSSSGTLGSPPTPTPPSTRTRRLMLCSSLDVPLREEKAKAEVNERKGKEESLITVCVECTEQ